MRVLIAALLTAALLLLAPHKQATPAHINKVERPTKVVQVRPAAPRKEPEHKTQGQVKPKPSSTPGKTKANTASAARPAQGCESYRQAFAQYAWNVRMAIAICKAESGGNVYAFSSTGDRGLMQINDVHANMVDYNLSALYNPYTNIRVAYKVYLGQGWKAWSAYKNGSYLAYL